MTEIGVNDERAAMNFFGGEPREAAEKPLGITIAM
jgi:hypothetical protein